MSQIQSVIFDFPLIGNHKGLYALMTQLTPKPFSCVFVNKRWTAVKVMVNEEVLVYARMKSPMDAQQLLSFIRVGFSPNQKISDRIRAEHQTRLNRKTKS